MDKNLYEIKMVTEYNHMEWIGWAGEETAFSPIWLQTPTTCKGRLHAEVYRTWAIPCGL